MKRFLPLLFILFISSGMVFSQIYVSPGEGTLSSALSEAEDGDVFQLVPDGLYTESTNFEFGTFVNQSVTIEVEGDGSVKAKIQMLTPETMDDTPAFFRVGDLATLTLRGIEFDGSLNSLPSASYLVVMHMGAFPAPTNIRTIRVENCYIHDLASDVIAAGSSDMAGNVLVDSTFVDDVVIENTATSIYYKYAAAKFISIRNSTFNTITSYGMRISGTGENNYSPFTSPEVIIDRTTWYNIGTTDGREIIQVEKEPFGFNKPWTVTNSIFAKQVDKGRTVINIKDTAGDSMATITNIALWDIGNINFRSHTVADTIRTDPQFADPENGDFTLPGGSILLSYGSRGGALGDPRWAVNSTGIEDEINAVPNEMHLEQNYPNPFNPETKINFTLNKSGFTRIRVFDILGRTVSELINQNMSAGTHNITFDGSILNSGIYFYQLQTAEKTMTRKMILFK